MGLCGNLARITAIGTSTIEGRILESRASQQVNSTQGRFIPAERYGDLENGGHLHIPSWDELNIHIDTFRSSNENNPIVTDRPFAVVNDRGVKPLTLCSLSR